MAAALIGAIAAPIVGGLVGNLMSQGDRAKQRKMMNQALAELKAAGMPPDLSKEIILREFQQVGILTPELEQELSLAESEVAKIKEDQSNIDKQKQALEMVSQVARGGARAEDKSALADIRQQVQRDAEAKRQQVLSQMASRGMAGSGNELIAQLGAGQQAAELASQQGLQVSADASRRALDAMQRQGSLAGDIRGQDFSVNEAKSKALDDRNRFMYENSTGRQSRNIAAKNAAQAANLSDQQRIADANINMANTEKVRQNQAGRDYWQDKMQRATNISNASLGQASAMGQQADRTSAMYSGIGSGIGTGASAYGDYQLKQQELDLKKQALDKGIK